MDEKFFCPVCKAQLEVLAACGSSSYFCNRCKKLVSSKEVLAVDDKDADSIRNTERKISETD